MNLHPNMEGLKAKIEQQAAIKEKNTKHIMEMLINSDDGLSVKEIAISMSISSNTVRGYIKSLIESGAIYAACKEGNTVIYKVADNKTEVPEVKEEVMPVGHSGKEFAPGSYIPVTDKCRPGDVVWISSRSGEGAFFRYLIITPWEHKAMVLGIFEEGHPKLDLNDPYYVCIGNDPETGKKLYADLRNNCQRGYQQFGERLMHVDQDSFDVVKCRLARSMGIDRMKVKEVDPDVVKLLKKTNDRLKEQIATLKKELANSDENYHTLEVRLKAATDELESVKADNKELTESYRATLLREEEARKGWDDSNRLAEDAVAERDKLYEELNSTKEKTDEVAVKVNQELVVDLQSENERLKEQLIDLSMQLASDSAKIAAYEKHEDTLTKLLFCMIKGGKND